MRHLKKLLDAIVLWLYEWEAEARKMPERDKRKRPPPC